MIAATLLSHCLFPQRDGVKIFIQIYREVELAIQLGGEYAQNVLKHPNIVVSG